MELIDVNFFKVLDMTSVCTVVLCGIAGQWGSIGERTVPHTHLSPPIQYFHTARSRRSTTTGRCAAKPRLPNVAKAQAYPWLSTCIVSIKKV